jgi:phosphohistidine phosphatase
VRTLYLLRHAKSSWKDESLPDRERPLATRGRKAAERMSEHLRNEGVAPDLVLCSPALRARETLERVSPGLGGDVETEFEDELYGAGAHELLALLRKLPPAVGSALLIGHNPALEQLASSLAGSGARLEELRHKYPTSALATVAFEGAWNELRPGGAELTGFVKPRELG